MSKLRRLIIALKLAIAMILMQSATRDANRELQAERAENDKLKACVEGASHE